MLGNRGLRKLNLDVFYDATGAELLDQVVLPALHESKEYDRVSAYFNLSSFISIGAGLDHLRNKSGRMRLLMGAHDVDIEIVEAVRYADIEEIMTILSDRITRGVSNLHDELSRDRIKATAWMLHDGLLEIKCVAPKVNPGEQSIFHNKRLIFRDEYGNMVSASGSVNETGAGLGGNFEELTIHSSWNHAEFTAAHLDRFERVWHDKDDRLTIFPVGKEFAEELLERIQGVVYKAQVPRLARNGISDVLTKSPILSLLNTSRTPMYPHQERVVSVACSRWPIRALLADEVGLGKTYEAASIISFALRHAGVSRVVVLAPPTLLRQWQDELNSAFGLDFWRYDSQNKTYVSSSGSVRQMDDGPFGSEYPELTIVSRDLARGTRKKGHLFQNLTVLPQMVVLDEAHTIRKIRSGKDVRPSLMGRMMQDVLNLVPHALFLTATPLQLRAEELYDALELLGVPREFTIDEYNQSLSLLTHRHDEAIELNQAATASKIIRGLLHGYDFSELRGLERTKFTEIALDSKKSNLDFALEVQKNWPQAQELLMKSHPAAILCVRNTRATLSYLGYEFPERVFQGIACETSDKIMDILTDLDKYLSNNLGMVEAALYPEKRTAVGFVQSVYRQRVASSLVAVRKSLERRLVRIEGIRKGNLNISELVDEDTVDEDFDYLNHHGSIGDANLQHACAVETLDISNLLKRIRELSRAHDSRDPKIEKAIEMTLEFIAGDKKVLLFSRYTDTISEVLNRFAQVTNGALPYAVYTGEGGLVVNHGVEVQGDKNLVTDALAQGTVRIVFCSDAASEGLNLHSASVLINIDVPWNPARLEQRIGRVARLGQVEPQVDIVNLWYPNSIEATIYSRVLSRRDIMELALGKFPEIVGDAIKKAAAARRFSEDEVDVVEELNKKRGEAELEALNTLWTFGSSNNNALGSVELRREILNAIQEVACVAQEKYGIEVDFPDEEFIGTNDLLGPKFTLHPQWLSWLDRIPTARVTDTTGANIGFIIADSKPLAFALEDEHTVSVLSPMVIPDLLRVVLLAERQDLSVHVQATLSRDQLATDVLEVFPEWFPGPSYMNVPVENSALVPPLPSWAVAGSQVKFQSFTL